MSQAIALKQAARSKRIHVEAALRIADRAEAARKQWEWDHFEPLVYGQPRPGTSHEEYLKIISDAKARHQNVLFGWNPNYEAQARAQATVGTRPKLGWLGRLLAS